jgi:CDGSH-type Zn-finger protein
MPILKPGTYHWCACGKSKTGMFCDGSHTGTDKTPVEFKVTEEQDVPLCGCGKTKNPPYCDGTHEE